MSLPSSQWPTRLEQQLGAWLRRRQRLIRSVVRESLRDAPRLRQDAEAEPNPFVIPGSVLAERIRQALRLAAPFSLSGLRKVAKSIATFVTAGIARALGAPVPPPDSALLGPESLWLSEVAGRVAALEDEAVSRALTAAVDAAQAGADPVKAADEALDRSEARAVLLARDVTGTFVAAVSAVRAPRMGARRYRWTSLMDGRERQLHAELHGRVFSFDEPGPDNGLHPSEPYNCRCRAVPVKD